MALRRFAAPAVLVIVLVALMAFGLINGRSPAEEAPRDAAPQASASVFRCHACARIAGKSWTPCRTVTARGTEEATRELARERVCSEAEDPEAGCRVFRLDCRDLGSERREASKRPPRVEVVEE